MYLASTKPVGWGSLVSACLGNNLKTVPSYEVDPNATGETNLEIL